jgi:hypothetical protein
MLEKKILTVASAIGILACGACFLPPLPERKPPPPPLRLNLDGIQSICVVATNSSGTHQLDPVELAQGVAHAINSRAWKDGINAFAGKEDGNADAVLRITILNETVDAKGPASQANPGSMTFSVKDTATLTRRDGLVVWSETESENSILRHVRHASPTDASNDTVAISSVISAVGNRIVIRMFYIR